MGASHQDVSIHEGDTPTRTLTFTRDGDRVDLTDKTVELIVKTRKDLADDNSLAGVTIYSTADPPGGITLKTQSGDTLGQADVALVAADIGGVGQYFYRARVDSETYVAGMLTVEDA